MTVLSQLKLERLFMNTKIPNLAISIAVSTQMHTHTLQYPKHSSYFTAQQSGIGSNDFIYHHFEIRA